MWRHQGELERGTQGKDPALQNCYVTKEKAAEVEACSQIFYICRH